MWPFRKKAPDYRNELAGCDFLLARQEIGDCFAMLSQDAKREGKELYLDKNFVAALHSFAANPLLETAIPLLEVSPGLLTYFQECSPGGRFYYSHVAADVREAHSKKIRVHTIGRPPEFNDPHELDEWIMNHGGNTYHIEEWDIGVHVSEENVAKWKDPRTGDLYLVNRIVDGKWKCAFCKYDVFVKLQAAMGGK